MGAADPGLRVRSTGGEFRPLIAGATATGFRELQKVRFTAPSELGGDLYVDDVKLRRSDTGWSWTPGFYAGEVRAEFVSPGGHSLGRYRIDVSPDPSKLGDELFRQMLREMVEFDPALLEGAGPTRHTLGPLRGDANPTIEFVRMRRRAGRIRRTLAEIGKRPIRGLRNRRDLVPPRRMRRADHRTVRLALRRRATRSLLLDGAPAAHDALSARFDVPSVEHTLDTPANRVALAMLLALIRRCGEIAGLLAALAPEDPDQRESRDVERSHEQARAKRWIGILKALRRDFERTRRKLPLSAVRRPGLSAAGLNAVAAHPLYARFYRLAWEALRQGIGDSPDDPLPLSPTWGLYERWCLVAMARWLRELRPDLGPWRETPGLRWRSRSAQRDLVITLTPQATAPSANGQTRPNLWSVSAELRPDLVLEWKRSDGHRDFLVLDAKYRTGRRNILSGMTESAHVYQDALRMGSGRPVATLLLVPDAANVAWLAEEAFVRENRVGAIPLRPGADPPSWLGPFLSKRIGDRRAALTRPA